MSENITISSTNNIGLYNSTYRYDFITGSKEFDDDTYISTNQIILPNSVANISPALNNNRFGYISDGYSYIGNTGNSPVVITLNSSVVNSNVLSLNITNGFLWNGYAILFDNLTTSEPIYITNISINDVNSSTASVSINQNITLNAGSTGTARIVGNQMIIQTTYGVPKPNMLIDLQRTRNSLGVLTLINGFFYIVSVSPQNQTNTNNIFLLTLNNSIPYEAQFYYYELTTQTNYFYPITLSTGYYNIEDINYELQRAMFNNGHYIIRDATTGLPNASIVYPTSLSTDYVNYKCNLTCDALPSNVVSTYGTNAYVNNNYVINWDFNDVIINTNSIVEPVNLNGWAITTSNGGRVFLQNGTISLSNVIIGWNNTMSPPNANFNQFAILTSTIVSSSSAKITGNSIGLIAGSYTLYYWARKTNTGSLDTLTITLDTTYTTNSISGSNWARYSQSFTLAVDSAIPLSFEYTTTNPTQPIGLCITGIQIISNKSPVNNPVMWANGYTPSSQISVFLGAFQTPSSYSVNNINQLRYEYTNQYSLKKYLTPNTIVEGQTIIFGRVSYGLSLNPFYGALIRCNLAENPMTANSDIIDAFPFLYSFGANNIYIGDSRNDIKIKKGRYNNITFQLVAQDGTPLTLLDNNVLMTFVIKNRKMHI